jgi:hypothetical protein
MLVLNYIEMALSNHNTQKNLPTQFLKQTHTKQHHKNFHGFQYDKIRHFHLCQYSVDTATSEVSLHKHANLYSYQT